MVDSLDRQLNMMVEEDKTLFDRRCCSCHYRDTEVRAEPVEEFMARMLPHRRQQFKRFEHLQWSDLVDRQCGQQKIADSVLVDMCWHDDNYDDYETKRDIVRMMVTEARKRSAACSAQQEWIRLAWEWWRVLACLVAIFMYRMLFTGQILDKH